MKIFKMFGVMIVVLLSTACDPAVISAARARSDIVDIERTQEAVDEMTYAKSNKNGLCFGILKGHTGDGSTIRSVTNVPCEKVQGQLGK